MPKADKKPPPKGEKSTKERMKQPPDQKHRRKRGKRGGKKRNRKNAESETAAPATTTWRPLETEWFRTVKAQGKSPNIPDALSFPFEKESEKDSSSAEQALRRLWQSFSRKRQRHSRGTETGETSWKPRPIQLQAWSILLQADKEKKEANATDPGINLIGLSPTASGKTLAFGAPMVVEAAAATSAKSEDAINQAFAIILVPTRELAQQVSRELETMVSCAQNSEQSIRVLTCCGGDSQSAQDQIRILRKGPPGCKWLISATPGRLFDIITKCQEAKREDIQFQPSYVVLDESDRLATNTDLAQQVTSILKACFAPQSTTLAFFSATYPHKARDCWREWMSLSDRPCAMIRVDSVSLENSSSPQKKQKIESAVEERDPTQAFDGAGASAENSDDDGSTHRNPKQIPTNDDTIRNDFLSLIPAHLVQTLHVCAEHKKPKKLINTLDKVRKEDKANGSRQKQLGIIFFGRIKTLQYVSKLLEKQSSHGCLELHSQLPQHVRTRNMQTFQAGKVPILLATDIAARGLHISNVSFVINYDFPANLEQYVHRCGRAGRNGNATNENNLPPTIYSFFTRSLAPLAPDLVALLQASKAWVDPNLKALVNDTDQSSHNKKKRKSKREQHDNIEQQHVAAKPASGAVGQEEELSDDDAFPELSANKVVLKRASHVSDASSSEAESGSECD